MHNILFKSLLVMSWDQYYVYLILKGFFQSLTNLGYTGAIMFAEKVLLRKTWLMMIHKEELMWKILEKELLSVGEGMACIIPVKSEVYNLVLKAVVCVYTYLWHKIRPSYL